MTMRRAVLAPTLVLALGVAGPLPAQGLHYEGGLSLSTGTYIFAERTTTWALSTGVAASVGRFTVRGSLPVYLQNTTLVTTTPFGRLPTGGPSSGAVADSGAARRRRHDNSGPMMPRAGAAVEVPRSAVTGFETAVGDPIVSLTARAISGTRGQVSFGGVVKAPVADTGTFGTGEWDLGAMAAVSWFPSPTIVLGADVAYWHLGDFGALDFRDPAYGTASIGYLGRRGWGGSFVASAGTAAIEGFDGPVSIGASVLRVGTSVGWSLTAAVGLTDTAPDLALGVNWRVPLIR